MQVKSFRSASRALLRSHLLGSGVVGRHLSPYPGLTCLLALRCPSRLRCVERRMNSRSGRARPLRRRSNDMIPTLHATLVCSPRSVWSKGPAGGKPYDYSRLFCPGGREDRSLRKDLTAPGQTVSSYLPPAPIAVFRQSSVRLAGLCEVKINPRRLQAPDRNTRNPRRSKTSPAHGGRN